MDNLYITLDKELRDELKFWKNQTFFNKTRCWLEDKLETYELLTVWTDASMFAGGIFYEFNKKKNHSLARGIC